MSSYIILKLTTSMLKW